ncbi:MULTISPECIES: hypothetical protein [unclassified Exiguobacterium]|uniref:hypothetical protein n=1 Tax=unclassified Exiguobacterium TaxID=2644629 RepID=UPI001BEAE2FD|nr:MULTISPECIES: hypothetical protein [unclassified Exiguobacterium]
MKRFEIGFVCDSGLVGSVLGANVLRKRLRQEQLQVDVRSYRLKDVPTEIRLIVGPEKIVRQVTWVTDCRVCIVNHLLSEAAYDEVITVLRKELIEGD